MKTAKGNSTEGNGGRMEILCSLRFLVFKSDPGDGNCAFLGEVNALLICLTL